MAIKRSLAVFAFGCALHLPGTALAKEDQVLYCVPELATGILGENKNEYRESPFKLERFTVKVAGEFDRVTIARETMPCEEVYVESHQLCNGASGYSFRYDLEERRFVFIQSSFYGFISPMPVGPDTDILYAGICETF